jgi:hypothetical protein
VAEIEAQRKGTPVRSDVFQVAMRRSVSQPPLLAWASSVAEKRQASVRVGVPVVLSSVVWLANSSPVQVLASNCVAKLAVPLPNICGSEVANEEVYARMREAMLAKARFKAATSCSGWEAME